MSSLSQTILCIITQMPTRSQRPLVDKILGMEPLEIGQARFTELDAALLAMGTDFSPERLAAALDTLSIEVTVSTLHRWRREIGK